MSNSRGAVEAIPVTPSAVSASPHTTTGLRAAGLDLIGTQIAVEFQGVRRDNVAERIQDGLQTLTDTTGADAVFIALLDETGKTFEDVYCGCFW